MYTYILDMIVYIKHNFNLYFWFQVYVRTRLHGQKLRNGVRPMRPVAVFEQRQVYADRRSQLRVQVQVRYVHILSSMNIHDIYTGPFFFFF